VTDENGGIATWHYGVVAQWWGEFNTDDSGIAYYRDRVRQYGDPALDVGCGSGRVLVPLLLAGLDVDGCDVSGDMLAVCRARANRHDVHPRLYAQAMHELSIPREYASIYVCGTFGLGGDVERDREALNRFRRHLRKGGTLLLDVELLKADDVLRFWSRDESRELPEAWPPTSGRRLASDGSELELSARVLDFDPLEQVITRQMWGRRWRSGQVEVEEQYTLKERFYFRNEVVLMLERAGFENVRVEGDYFPSRPTRDTAVLNFIATSPSD
jgi:SAM-dependent methyltransferase